MKRILFVDDEQHVLDGLKNILRRERKKWDMVFALGGKAALGELERGAFDVVVSDMRMPGMDGAALLGVVRQNFPSTARIVLSGYAEQAAMLRALPVAQQFLSKPCEPDLLRTVIDRTCQLNRYLQSEGVRGVIGSIDRLPSAPAVYWELTRLVGSDEAGVSEVASVVETDPATSAQLLKLVNSGYFSLPVATHSVRDAIAYLGFETVRTLVLSAHVFSTVEGDQVAACSLSKLQRHSLMTARLARAFATGPDQALAFTAAMVHDIGELVLALALPDASHEVARRSELESRPSHEVELELVGASHAEVGAYLLGAWGLPFSVLESAAYHHTPLLAAHPSEVLTVVHAAAAFARAIHAAPSLDDAIEAARPDPELLERTGLAPRLSQWREAARAVVSSSAAA